MHMMGFVITFLLQWKYNIQFVKRFYMWCDLCIALIVRTATGIVLLIGIIFKTIIKTQVYPSDMSMLHTYYTLHDYMFQSVYSSMLSAEKYLQNFQSNPMPSSHG